MASFNSASFIVSYIGTDKAVRFKNTKGDIVGGFNVCTFDSIAYEKTQLWVNLSEGEKIVLDFSSNSECKVAFATLNGLIDTLYTNCLLVVPGPPTSPVVVNKLKSQFDTERGLSTLIPNTVYQVNDTATNDFNLPVAGIFQVIPLSNDASIMTGVNSIDGAVVTLDFNTNKVVSYHDTVNNNKIVGDASLFQKTGVVQNVDGFNSTIIADTVNGVKVQDSVATISNSTKVEVNNSSSIILDNVTNSYFYGVAGNYSAHIFSGIKADIRDLNSNKGGREVLSLTNNETLYSFKSSKSQDIQTLATSINKILDNAIPTVATQFVFRVPAAGVGVGLTLTIKDTSAVVLFVISDKQAGQEIVFTWDTGATAFKVSGESLPEFHNVITVSFNGQVNFVDNLPYTLLAAGKTHLLVNGNKQVYGYDYTISGRTLVWANADFSLETTDRVELFATSK